jgi:hypothetical protein
MDVLKHDGKVFRIGEPAAFKRGWGHASRQYENVVGKIVALESNLVRIEMPDGVRFGPTAKNAYHIPANNGKAKVLLDKEW